MKNNTNKISLIPSERILSGILFIRGKKVMLDRDLAELYQVETRVLIQAVKRNRERFPPDFMFQLNKKELAEFSRYQIDALNLISQIVISSHGGTRKLPYAFTEQGVAMLSSVLNSERAILVNIQIIRTFTKLILLDRHLKQVHFYQKLEKFGFRLVLKPVKMYEDEEGNQKRKANCDVEMAFYLMRDQNAFERVVILSGDGDFLPVLKHLRNIAKKEVFVLSRASRTAKEIRRFAGNKFINLASNNMKAKFERIESKKQEAPI
ncbi:ORF6N domain-containing protein [Candidatus Nomurabacteria bacterium]|nr:ORF6N domain-containing protein [Candidatus Nomurabacteria bacterium]